MIFHLNDSKGGLAELAVKATPSALAPSFVLLCFGIIVRRIINGFRGLSQLSSHGLLMLNHSVFANGLRTYSHTPLFVRA
jgi:hypothetical protein